WRKLERATVRMPPILVVRLHRHLVRVDVNTGPGLVLPLLAVGGFNFTERLRKLLELGFRRSSAEIEKQDSMLVQAADQRLCDSSALLLQLQAVHPRPDGAGRSLEVDLAVQSGRGDSHCNFPETENISAPRQTSGGLRRRSLRSHGRPQAQAT